MFQVTFTIESIRKFINSQFVLKSHKHTLLKLRGQMVWMESLGCMLYLCSPKLRSLQELQDVGLHLADLAQHDVTRDLVLLNQQRLAEMELTNQLERKKVGAMTLFIHYIWSFDANFVSVGGAENSVEASGGREREDGDSAVRHAAAAHRQ